MTDITPVWLLLGAFALICGIGLALVKVDKVSLVQCRHSNPGMALLRFRIWRWFIVSISCLIGMFFIGAGLGVVQL